MRRPRRASPPAAAVLLLLAFLLIACRLWGDSIDRSTIRNVIVVTMDTTRADRLGAYGYEAIKTPNIDGLAQRGVLFETAITPVPLTLPSHTTIFTGLLPTHHGVRNNGTFKVPRRLHTLAEILKKNGFRTGAVIGAFVLDSKYGLDQGFETYDDNLFGGKDAPMFMFNERSGRVVTDQGLAWLEARGDERFFLWLHYFDPHANYEPPPPFDVLYDGQPYDGEIAGVDAQIGRLVEALDDLGRLSDTLIILTGDHGESLGEHGERTHSLLLYDATLHVPLILSHPSLPQAARIGGPVSTVDTAPTVLDLLGISGERGIDGTSLVPVIAAGGPADREVYIETLVPFFNNGWAELRGIRTAETKYIRAPRPELYDVAADARELRNVIERRSDAAQRLALRLDTYLATDVMHTGDAGDAAMQLTAADRERLAALGYDVDGVAGAMSDDLPDPKDQIVLWEELQAAQNLMREHQHEKAVPAFRALLEKDPGNVMAHSSLGNALAALGDLDGAEEQFEIVAALDPRRLQGTLALARLHRRRGDREKAFETLKAALEADSGTPELANAFAELFQDAGNADKAIEWYEEALRRDPLHVTALIGIGNVHHRAGRETDARAALERALEIDPHNADALYNLGVVAEAQDREDEALALYRRALEVEPAHVESLNNLGSYFHRRGEKGKAAAAYGRVVELRPSHFEATYNLGTLALEEGNLVRAIELLEHALELNPRAGVVYNNLSLAYLRSERQADAIAVLRRAAESNDGAVWWLRLARVEARSGREAEAREHLRKAIEAGGDAVQRRATADEDLRRLLLEKGGAR